MRLKRLEEVKQDALFAKTLVLDESVLGLDAYSLAIRLLDPEQDLAVFDCEVSDAGPEGLRVTGELDAFLSFWRIPVSFWLFDLTPDGARRPERHCLFTTRLPEGYKLKDFLTDLGVQRSLAAAVPDGTATISAGSETPRISDPARKLEASYFLDSLGFASDGLVFSSFAPGAARYASAAWPKEAAAVAARAGIHAGLNFGATARLSRVAAEALESVLARGGSDGAALFRGAVKNETGISVLNLAADFGAQKSIGPVSLGVKRLILDLAVSGFGRDAPAVSFEGSMEMSGLSADVLARLDLETKRLRLSLRDRRATLSSSEKFASSVGVKDLGLYFPGSMASLGGLSLVKLDFEADLGAGFVHSFGFALAAENELTIIDGRVAVRPLLDVQVTKPFDAASRSVRAALFGRWTLGETPFNVLLFLPDFDFSAEMAVGYSLDMAAAVEKLLPGVELPKIELMDLELSGSFKNKSFEAEIDVATDWEFSVAGKAFAVRELNMAVSYAEKAVQDCSMTGRMTAADFDFDVTAEYDKEDGWFVRGGTRAGQTIDFATLYNRLTDGLKALSADLALPPAYFALRVKDLFLEYQAKSGRITFYTSLDHSFTFTKDFSLNTFYIRLSAGEGKLSGQVRAKLDVAGVDVFLSGEKPEKGDGLLFSGGTGIGQPIPIVKLMQDLARKFGVDAEFPASLAGLTIKDLQVSFHTETKDFSLTFGADLDVSGQKVEAKIGVDIRRSKAHDGYEKSFRGDVLVGARKFALRFFADGSASGLLASYRKEGGEVLDLKTFASSVSSGFSTAVPEGLSVKVKDVMLLYSKDDAESRWIFGFNLAMELGVSSLPVAGALPEGRRIQVKNLRFLAASRDVKKAALVRLNRCLPSDVPRLPEQDMGSGVGLTADVVFGDKVQLLAILAAAHSEQAAQSDEEFATGPSAGEAYDQVQKADRRSLRAKWFDVQKALGPVSVQRAGLAYGEGNLWILVDAAVSLGGLSIGFNGLAVGSPLNEFKPKLRLEGLGLDYGAGGALELRGAFTSSDPDGGDGSVFLGEALIKTKALTISALGAYGKTASGDPTICFFAFIDYPLGGPAFFYVTGLAVGYGYNSRLNLPRVEKVRDFSLIRAVMPDNSRPNPFVKAAAGPLENLKAMGTDVRPSAGDQWLAAGVRFTSFKMVQSFALLVVKLGSQDEIALLGLSRLSVPAESSSPIAYAELMLQASYSPSTGRLAVEGRLSPASYIFSGDCRLTGGFAFYTWFSGPHAGDFVVTLGGYHPRFEAIKPSHYPSVPRLAFRWQVDSSLTMKGQVYFALIPSGLMAGGRLEVAWKCGDVKAWYSLEANFWINWEPFHYQADMHIQVGASYRLNLLLTSVTMSVNVGARLYLWGPPFAGRAEIDLGPFTIKISFGSSNPRRDTIPWDQFKRAFLPPEPEAVTPPAVDSGTPTRSVCAVRAVGGLIKDLTNENDSPYSWIISPELFEIATQTAIPAKSASFNGHEIQRVPPAAGAAGAPFDLKFSAQEHPRGWRDDLGIRPMGIRAGDEFTSRHAVRLRRRSSAGAFEAVNGVAVQPLLSGAPKALWGGDGPSADGSGDRDLVIGDALSGFRLLPKARRPLVLKDIELEPLLYAQNERRTLPASAAPRLRANPFDARVDEEEGLSFKPSEGAPLAEKGYVLASLAGPAAKTARDSIVACLVELGLDLDAKIDLSRAVEGDAAVLQDWPVVAPLDEEAVAA